MASEIRVNQIQNRSGLSTVTFSDTGVVISGITTISDLRTTGGALTVGTGASIFSPATNVLALGTANTEDLRIDASGNLGIGTNNPARILDIYSASGSNTVKLTANGTSAGFVVDSVGVSSRGGYYSAYQGGVQKAIFGVSGTVEGNTTGDAAIFADGTGGNIRFYSNGSPTEVARLTSSGNLGIGTAVPSQKLEVVGGEIKAGRVDSSYEGGQFSLARSTDNATAWYMDVYGNTSTPQLRFVDVSTSSVRANIDSSGNFTVNSGNLVIGTAGKGIDFSATANSSGTMSSELLADYEEGTWTPSIGGNATYSVQQGSYVKIGKMVYINFYLGINLKGTGSNTTITGLPYASAAKTGGGPVAYWYGSASAVVYISSYTYNSSQLDLYSATSGTGTLGTSTIFQNGTTLQASIVYEAA